MKIWGRGDIIGYRDGKPIHKTITYYSPLREVYMEFTFNRQAVEDREGVIRLNQLNEGEIMLAPGLIYS